MILEHIAAILLFSGPLFYLGLWMAIDPVGFASLPQFLLRCSRMLVQTFGGPTSEPIVKHAVISRRAQKVLRSAGVVLVLFAIAPDPIPSRCSPSSRCCSSF